MAGHDATIALMTAVRAALLADSALLALLATSASVYDVAPENAQTPFIAIGVNSYQDWSTVSTDGQLVTLNIDCWDESRSHYPETTRCRMMMRHCRRILHYARLTPPAPYRSVLMVVANRVGPLFDPDGISIHGILQLQTLTDV